MMMLRMSDYFGILVVLAVVVVVVLLHMLNLDMKSQSRETDNGFTE
jgi:hypothetical protein